MYILDVVSNENPVYNLKAEIGLTKPVNGAERAWQVSVTFCFPQSAIVASPSDTMSFWSDN